ncbi:hypothetical protein [Methylibium sp.]|uniref:hypothetical protein n=1 Tax=Methylibium sp. TaxID=2067992 RepID=UPI0017D6EAAB|nr:hypothetical protein [Methylibium sp.]MBA3589516.1 hypothetical protein [Methylibium sp.]
MVAVAGTLVGAPAFVAGAGGLSVMTQAIGGLYQIVGGINDFIDDHIETLKKSPNPTISGTGRVLEGAKYGFGIGYVIPVAVIAIGQVLLGNTLAAIGTIVTTATLTNPIAMTCAAIGAIYYGWQALDDKERAAILERLAKGLDLGVELIRSLVDFVIRTTKSFLSSEQLTEFKGYIKEQAAKFGRSLYDVTGKVGDLVKGSAEKVGKVAGEALKSTTVLMKGGADVVREAGTAAGSATTDAVKRTGKAVSKAVEVTVSTTRQALRRGSEKAPTEEKPALLSDQQKSE